MEKNIAKGKFLITLFYLSIFALYPSCSMAKSPLEAELLIFEEVPIVITASKYEQPIAESPATISVITSEDIKQSGVRDIQEVLRSLPGVEVMASKTSQIDVGIRGDITPLYNGLLVMVDGRSVYQDFYGMTEWEHLEIGLEEIKRIEVIRGPGSALYGANAFTGVINIITKSPEEMKSTLVNTGGGNFHNRYVDIYHANTKDNWKYKYSTGWREANRWGNRHEDSLDIARFNGLAEYYLDEKEKVSLSGGASTGETELFIPGTGGGTFDSNDNVSYLKTEYNKKDMYLRAFWNRTKFHANKQDNSELRINGISNIYDVELQDSFLLDLWKTQRITWGTSYRLNTIRSEQIDKSHKWNLYAGYVQDELRLNDKLLLYAGLRLDYHPLTHQEITPRGSIVYTFKEGHLIRLWAGTSFKTPSYAELYSDTRQGLILVRGNPELKSQKIVSYDLGYEFALSKRAKGKINFFYNKMEKLIEAKLTGLTNSYYNEGKRNAKGCEPNIEFLITDWLKGFINYTFQDLKNEVSGGRYGAAPMNKVNSGLRFTFHNGFSANLAIHYVDNYEVSAVNADSYTLANCRIGYAIPKKDLEVSLSIYNLLRDKHREYPSSGDEIGTSSLLNISYKF